jgi:hypothetical protein
VNPVPIALAFLGATALFAAWAAAMTRDQWWSSVTPAREWFGHTLDRTRVAIAREIARETARLAARPRDAQSSWWPSWNRWSSWWPSR